VAKKIFEDMVRVKREKRRLASSPASLEKTAKTLKPKPEKSTKIKINKKPISVLKRKRLHARPREIEIAPEPSASEYDREDLIQDTVYNMGTQEAQKSSRLMWFVAIATVVVFLFALSFLFSRAKITIYPAQKEVVLNQDFYAVKDSLSALPFDLVIINGSDETTINAEERQDVAEKAYGSVVIYNDYNSATQALDVDTRLEGTNGKIYKTEKKIIVPGKSSDGTPGSIEVGVYAADSGEEYNSEPIDFTIVGFKGGPKYDGFYARSAEELSGGLVGFVPVASESKKAEAINSLRESLRTRLLSKATEQIPEGFILFDNAVSLEVTKEEIDLKAEGSEIPVKIEGTLYGFLFEEEELSKAISDSALDLPEESMDEVYISNLEDLTFTILNKPESFKDIKSINFSLSGRQNIVWRIDADTIASDLLDTRRKDFGQKMLEYPNVASADLVLKPIWRKTIPDEIEKVDVKVNYPD